MSATYDIAEAADVKDAARELVRLCDADALMSELGIDSTAVQQAMDDQMRHIAALVKNGIDGITV